MSPTRSSDHNLQCINPYVKEDLKCSKSVPLYGWVEAMTDVSQDRLLTWALKIKDMGWFEDAVIQKYLQSFCTATAGRRRYDPFAQMANRILDLARGRLPGVPRTKSYPLDNIRFVNSSGRPVGRMPSTDEPDGVREPDIILLSGPAAERFMRGEGAEWFEVLHWWEFRFTKVLTKEFNREREERGLPALAVNWDGQFVPMPKKAVQGPKKNATRRQRVPKSTKVGGRSGPRRRVESTVPDLPDDEPPAIRTGMKRPAVDNLLDRFDVGIPIREPRTSNDSSYIRCVGARAAIQSGSYALEALSSTHGTRLFSFGIVLKDDRLSLWYYDASGIVYTEECLSLVHDFEQTAALIIAFALCTPEQLGVVPSSAIQPSIPYTQSFPPPDFRKATCSVSHPSTGRKVRLTLQDPLFTRYCLAGRRTFLYSIEASPIVSKDELIAKFSYQVCTWKPEHELLAVARKAKVKHLPQVHMWADLWKLSEGKRRVFYEKSPEDKKATHEDRTLRVIVYTKYASVQDLFAERCDLIPVMVDQLLDCLHDLRYDANMLHQDISIDNIMFQIRQEKYWFVLIDFDMAVVLPQDPESNYVASSMRRTGTLPFMACELVYDAWIAGKNEPNWKSTRHRLRHDIESLFWVALWCIMVLLSDRLSENDAANMRWRAHSWEVGDNLMIISACKEAIITKGFDKNLIKFANCVRCLEPWFNAWRSLLKAAWMALDNREELVLIDEHAAQEPFDDETVGGTLSRDALKKVLTPLMPFRQAAFDGDELEDEAPDADIQDDTHNSVEAPNAKRRARMHVSPEEAAAARAGILSRLRPRRKPQ